MSRVSIDPHELRVAEKVAQRVGSRWANVEVDDLTSHLYLWLVENTDAVTRWRSLPSGGANLYVSLRREAAKYCARETAARVGRPLNADNFYTPELLSRALPYLFEDVPQTTLVVNPVSGQAVAPAYDFNEAVTIMADIRGTFYGLNPQVREVLEWRFRDGLTYEEIGELRNVTKDGALKQVNRAVQRLADALSGERL